jgi:hypothetical protein
METEFAVISNYTQLAEFKTMKEAKTFALDQSDRFDDAVTITKNGLRTHLASHGTLYRLTKI